MVNLMCRGSKRMTNPLSLDEVTALLERDKHISLTKKGYPPNKQDGPLRWYDATMRCTARGCASPTYCKVDGIPLCTMHSLSRLNDMVIDLTNKIKGVL